ncbi:MAG: ATP-binding cassette domain-containing protein [Phreatobacter sp.]|uniref:ABC transporter ATP-binding protein n=1 Tax=Phreatobacter sp. TaxID=1966341 RepID=UPI001A50E0CB|nr:ATP-binding cassette domain-containing protein [Phreatobacter sp.]MBL8570233.1 ATP-binding cassette domain-containing protein [Phreatobacter sp.]
MTEAVFPPALAMAGVGHSYFGRRVVDAVDLVVGQGEIVALVGPSGCGKSTLVHIAAGIVDHVRGTVERRYRRHGMVFQETRLMPWATARENIAYPLRVAGLSRAERRDQVEAAASRVALAAEDLDKYPVELSGGMRQRTAIARALVTDPDFIYFDEPFTALDVALKRRMQDLVIDAGRNARFGALFVTHDLAEATRIAHRIVVLDARGQGVTGERRLPGAPGERDDAAVFALTSGFLREDLLFRHIHDIDERLTA